MEKKYTGSTIFTVTFLAYRGASFAQTLLDNSLNPSLE